MTYPENREERNRDAPEKTHHGAKGLMTTCSSIWHIYTHLLFNTYVCTHLKAIIFFFMD